MPNILSFIYTSLNSYSNYATKNKPDTFDKVLKDFHDYLEDHSPIKPYLAQLMAQHSVQMAAEISHAIVGMPIGETYLLQQSVQVQYYSALHSNIIIKFKKESETVVSMQLYDTEYQKNRELNNTKLNITNLDASVNAPVVTRQFESNKTDELTRFLIHILKSEKDRENSLTDSLSKNLEFLQSDIQITNESFDTNQLHGQTYFMRALYRMLHDLVDPQHLERELLGFVRWNIAENTEIKSNHPFLYREAINNHIAYFQMASCDSRDQKNQYAKELLALQDNTALYKAVPYSEIEFSKLSCNTFNIQIEPISVLSITQDKPRASQIIIRKPSNLLKSAQALCDHLSQNENDNTGCMTSIEAFLLDCPISNVSDLNYMQKKQWIELGRYLEQIAEHYFNALQNHLNNHQTPKIWIAVCSIILLRSQCFDMEESGFSINPFVNSLLSILLSKIQLLPHLSTYDPRFDERWKLIGDHTRTTQQTIPKDYDINYKFNNALIEQYDTLLETTDDFRALALSVADANRSKSKFEQQTPFLYYIQSIYETDHHSARKEKIQQMEKLEQFFSRCFNQLIVSDSPIPSLEKNSFNSINTPLYQSHYYISAFSNFFTKPAFILATKEVCSENSLFSIALRAPFRHAVDNKPISSNSVQLSPHVGENDRAMTPEDLTLHRMLQYSLLDNPLPSLLSYYSGKMNELSNIDAQYYCFENLLCGRVLLPFMQEPSFAEYLDHFDAFIRRGLKQSEIKRNELTPESLFFIKLAMHMYAYIARSRHFGACDRLHNLLSQITDWIAKNKKDTDISAHLHQYRLFIVSILHDIDPQNQRLFADAFVSYGYLNVHAVLPQTVFEKTEQAQLYQQFQYWLQNTKSQVTDDLICALAAAIEIDLTLEKKITHKDDLVIINLGDNTVYFDLTSCVFLNAQGLRYSSIPQAIQKHPILAYLNQKPRYCFYNHDCSIIALAQDETQTTLHFTDEKVSVYRTLTIDGEPKRCALIPLPGSSDNKITFYNPPLFLHINRWETRQHHFANEHQCWVSASEQTAYITQNDAIIYTIKNNTVYYKEPIESKLLCLHSTKALNSFEDLKFCHARIDDKKNGSFELIRYPQLALSVVKNKIYMPYKEHFYQLKNTLHPSLFTNSAHVSHLLFCSTEEPERQIAVLTVRKFDKKGLYNSEVIEQSNQSSNDESTLLNTIVYDVDNETLDLVTHNAYDALFLAYVYTATYDYERALRTFQSIPVAELTGSQEEITILEWFTQLEIGESKCLAACQLHAFSLYTRCVQEKLNGQLSFKNRILDLSGRIVTCYHFYHENKNYLPDVYRLDTSAIQSLNHFFTDYTPINLFEKQVTHLALEKAENKLYISTWYTGLSQAAEKNLLSSVHGRFTDQEALQHLHSEATTDVLNKYLPNYVRMTQSSQYRPFILQFCKQYLISTSQSNIARILYFLCDSTVDLNKTIALEDVPSAFDTKGYEYTKIQETQHSVRLTEETIENIPLAPPERVETQRLKRFMEQNHNEFYNHHLALVQNDSTSSLTTMSTEELGALKLKLSLDKIGLIKSYFEDEAQFNSLLLNLNEQKDIIEHALNQQWEFARLHANSQLLTTQSYLIQAGRVRLLADHDLMLCYATANAGAYASKTLLNHEQVSTLHNTIHQAMMLAIECAQFQRLIDELNNGVDRINWEKLLDLMTREHVNDLQSQPDMIVLEYTKKIMIRLDQKEIADRLAQHEIIADGNAGVGKTSVIAPMVLSQAQKGTLPIMVVPRSLLYSTHRYLHSLQNVTAILFDFNRDHDISIAEMTRMHRTFVQIITNEEPGKKRVIVCASGTIQSLELKYIELLSCEQYQDYETQIRLLREILLIISTKGQTLVDEIHEVQDYYKSSLRYALAKPLPVSKDIVKDIIDLCRFTQTISYKNSAELLSSLLQHRKSRIHRYINNCLNDNKSNSRDQIENVIAGYLLNQRSLTIQISSRFETYLTTLRDYFLVVNNLVNLDYLKDYGPSQKTDSSALVRSINIPYFENLNPKEGSRFQNTVATILFTIEHYLRDFNSDLLQELLFQWRAKADNEYRNASDQYLNFHQTPTAMRFNDYFKQELSQEEEILEEQELRRLLDHITNESLYEILELDVLPTIMVDGDILESTASAHKNSYAFFAGMTATPDESNQSIPIYTHESSAAARESLAQLLIQQQTQVQHYDYSNASSFISALMKPLNATQLKQLRALIDIGGRIKNKNEEVAKAFAALLKQSQSPVKYVIYYSKDELRAISTTSLNKPKVLRCSTEAKSLEKTLGCTIDEMAVFYDEAHTKGTDFVLSKDAYAFAIIGLHSSFEDLVQGCKRLRAIFGEQRLTAVLPTTLSSITQIQEVIKYTKQQTEKTLAAKSFDSAADQVTSIFRRKLLDNVLLVTTIGEQHNLITQDDVKRLLNGGITFEVKNDTSLKKQLEAHVSSLQKQYPELCDNEKIQLILQQPMPEKITDENRANPISEVQTQIQIQITPPDLGVHFDPTLKPRELTPFEFSKKQSIASLTSAYNPSFDFVPTFFVSDNFLHLDANGVISDLINPYMKSVDLILFNLDKNKQLSACLITPEEANSDVMNVFLRNNRNAWLSTTQHVLLSGNKPKGVEQSPDYQSLIEQLRFFGGKFSELVEQKEAYQWLPDNPRAKFDAYIVWLKKYRENDEHNFTMLSDSFSVRAKLFDEMTKKPFVDYTVEDYPWFDHDPDIADADIDAFRTLATAYKDMNKSYWSYDSQNTSLRNALKAQYHLSAATLAYLQRHINLLLTFKDALSAFLALDQNYLDRVEVMPEECRKIIELILGENVEQLVARYDSQHRDHADVYLLGRFLTSNAFPDGARALFAAPIQTKLDALSTEKELTLFSDLNLNEYTLLYLLDALILKEATLVWIIKHTQNPETALKIVTRYPGNENSILAAMEKYSNNRDILNQATQHAMTENTFMHLIGYAQEQNCLFEQEWLTCLFTNKNVPVVSLLVMLHHADITDDFLNRVLDDERVIDYLIHNPQELVTALNAISDARLISYTLKHDGIIRWINEYARHKPSDSALTQTEHSFYNVLFDEPLNQQADHALAYLIQNTQSKDVLISRTLVAYQRSSAYMVKDGRVYHSLLDAHQHYDTIELITLLIECSTSDASLKKISSQHLDALAESMVRHCQDLSWLILQNKDNMQQAIVKDKRFDSVLARSMLKQDLSPDVMSSFYATVTKDIADDTRNIPFAADLFVDILRDSRKSEYHERSCSLLINKRISELDSNTLLFLIELLPCSATEHFSDLIYQKNRNNGVILSALLDKGLKNPLAVSFDVLNNILTNKAYNPQELEKLLKNNPMINALNSSEEGINHLLESATILQRKALDFLNKKTEPYNQAAKEATQLYLCLRHQLSLYQEGKIDKQTLNVNINTVLAQTKSTLIAHRGYRQICYDIAQALLCLVGIGLVMTAYAAHKSRGQTIRFFKHENESERTIKGMEALLCPRAV
jgi:hypothetical protein